MPWRDFLFELTRLSSLALLALVFLLTGGLMLSKIARQLWARYAARREEFYKAAILEAIAGEPGAGLEPVFRRGRRFGDRVIIEECLLRWGQGVSGFGFERLRDMFERGGFADDEIRRLGSLRWWVRAMAVRRLGVMLCARAAPALVAALEDVSLDVRLQAAWALGRLGQLSALDRIIGSLAGDSRLAALRVTNIILELGPRTAPVLEQLLENPEPRVQEFAIRLLGSLGQRDSSSKLVASLYSGDLELRIAACSALGRLGAQEAAGLVVLCLDDPEWPMRARAALVLGELGYDAGIPRLRQALRDHAWFVRFNAGEALARLGESGKRALTGCLSDDDRFARDMAAQWLEELSVGAIR